ncbi:MAG TPA: hypothetical protein VH684_27875 [Xanthobacteraceae bacterium]|jgi:hypothetical protein
MRIRRAQAVDATQHVCGRAVRIAGGLLCALAAGACVATGETTGSIGGARGITVAIESIDGPPYPVVRKITQDLAAQASARRIVVVEHGKEAAYRLRGYLATHATPSGISIAWAWDVYDSAQHRVFRLRGEDRTAGSGQSWLTVDDQTLLRIVNASLDQLAGFLAPGPSTAAQAAQL